MDSIKSYIKNDIQLEENIISKKLDYWMSYYKKKFKSKDVEKIYDESEKIIDKYIDRDINVDDKIKLEALKYLLDEYNYINENR